jgi:hypothetical protein
MINEGLFISSESASTSSRQLRKVGKTTKNLKNIKLTLRGRAIISYLKKMLIFSEMVLYRLVKMSRRFGSIARIKVLSFTFSTLPLVRSELLPQPLSICVPASGQSNFTVYFLNSMEAENSFQASVKRGSCRSLYLRT